MGTVKHSRDPCSGTRSLLAGMRSLQSLVSFSNTSLLPTHEPCHTHQVVNVHGTRWPWLPYIPFFVCYKVFTLSVQSFVLRFLLGKPTGTAHSRWQTHPIFLTFLPRPLLPLLRRLLLKSWAATTFFLWSCFPWENPLIFVYSMPD